MKAITVQQPWAHLICANIKPVENRKWKTNFRGRVLIHASAKPNTYPLDMIFTREQLDELLQRNTEYYWCGGKYGGVRHDNSAIIGSIEIIDCVKNHPSVWAEKDAYNWVLAYPVLFIEPVKNVKGKLSFWDYPGISAERNEDGVLTCTCSIPVDEESQVNPLGGGYYECRYCGGKWYK
jgi:hypothetical protein